MKDRLLKNWTMIRVLYIVLGIGVFIQSLLLHTWLGLIIGTYFTAMGLFAFGCAGGTCYSGTCRPDSTRITNKKIKF